MTRGLGTRAARRAIKSSGSLDEPTASLDTRTELELFKRFKSLTEGRTTLLISHRFSTIAMADRIVVLAESRVVEMGTHEELVAKGGTCAALFGLHRRQLLDLDGKEAHEKELHA